LIFEFVKLIRRISIGEDGALKKISNWLIVIGILIILIPVVGSLYTYFEQQALYNDYLANPVTAEDSYEDLQSTFADLQALDQATAPAVTTPVAVVPAYKPKVMGRIQVPKIDEDMLLVEGVKQRDLKFGAGHIPGTALPGEIGNCAIAGHRNYTFGSYFNRLDEVVIGDRVTIEFNKKSYTYEVYEKLVVLPEDTSVLNKNDTDKILTLITCTPIRVATHRLILHAKLVE
jgi:sortase A